MGDVLDKKYILALDVGSTTIRCHVLNKQAESLGAGTDKVTELYPERGRVEISPTDLWSKIRRVVDIAILNSKISVGEIRCLGISTQRGTFITWNRTTGEPYHNFISWKDIRADSLVKSLNGSLWMRSLRYSAWFLYMVTRSSRFLAGSNLQLMNVQVTVRLLWVLENIQGLREAAAKGDVMFGTLDTWILYKLSGGEIHVSDISSASATGLFDPFTLSWAEWAFFLFKIPSNILPQVVDSAGHHFGHVKAEIWGEKIPIQCSLADQAASLFGSGCFKAGDLKVTLGTGSFLSVNTGQIPHASVAGLYPLVGWRIKDELVYAVEGSAYDTGSLISWANLTGIIPSVEESSRVASSVNTSDGVYFIPAFSGLQAPINDSKAAAGFIGVKPSTSLANLVRAILESIIFRTGQLYEILLDEASFSYSHIRIDGGVSKNDFVCQSIANHTGLAVERPVFTDVSILGVAYMAGLFSGLWKSRDEIIDLRKLDQIFSPKPVSTDYKKAYLEWEKAILRFKNWYS
ncbi:unnamed protein product [Bemisia tabaci]|uniref:Glycerol kinase 5 n=1 Tax=Bemisia tabaci TaxID=7038 RepID=A0A9P0AGE9_BEMTA|nr:unnamed protein product [Bemisia tabaci]